ncbi:hypothetical protein [Pelotomaculum propionicicum]|uniref:Uncharacterized protein n=1 Tax=Pelotomaculum propionicicum TaxID=258475 RepID=A0A4Y7RLU9_9FIRM|nr:hypothetical protein [Pelotomaculum propionicicum]NLI13399.1 hypothetical protein [Peptococcaceae bacterium]TEB09720.1 hypothetical protein Pmgp_02897 [Pelotomaculum propionicicum]
MKWQLGDERDSRIIKYDGWLDLLDIEAPDKQGVFVFVAENMEVKYVGCAHKSLSDEIQMAVSQGKSSGAWMFAWYITDSQSDAEILKAYWVSKYKPENN